MTDFALELGAGRIVHHQSRSDFREVLASFTAGHYRSALVVLWTVVVCDLVYKLQDLRDLHDDEIARSILANIESQQTRNPTAPAWERQLLDEINQRTHLLNQAEYQGLIQVHEQRHLAAHPILTETHILYQPSPEMTRACIRIALESVLLKPPIFTREVVDALLEDLEEKKAILPDDESLQRYLEAKYFPRLVRDLENRLFRSLWKLTFRLENDRTTSNREINFRTLCILYGRDRQARNDYIADDREFFSELGSGPGLLKAIDFLSRFPAVYELLTEAARTPIRHLTDSDLKIFARAWFLSDSVQTHLQCVRERVENAREGSFDYISWRDFLEAASREDGRSSALLIGFTIYLKSENYDSADHNFQVFVFPYLGELTVYNLEHLFAGIESNGQTTGRWRSERDHRPLIERYEALTGSTPDPEKYPNLMQPFNPP